MPAQIRQKGFWASLFDLSFGSLIGIRVAAVLYVVALVCGGLAIIGGAVFGTVVLAQLEQAGVLVVLPLMASPVLLLLYVIATRFQMELVVVLFRIAENTAKTVRLLGTGVPMRAMDQEPAADEAEPTS